MPHPAILILEKYKSLLWPKINSYLKDPIYPKSFQIPQIYTKETKHHWKMVRDYPERKGKYIRPSLLLLTSESMGVPAQKALKTAAAMQLSEEWMLMHDDFEDNSLMRRGKLTSHRIYGPELSVNAGDALHAIMWKVLKDNEQLLGAKTTFALMNEFYTMLMRTILGQGVEIAWTKLPAEIFTDDQWYFIADGKTSYYTIALPMRLGAILGKANNKQLDMLSDFGIYLGRCFQLVDDILDVTSDFNGLKQKGNDVYEGKKTIMLGHLLRNASYNDKKIILSILKKSRDEKTQDEVAMVISKMQEYKSIDYAKKMAEYFKENALEIFDNKLNFLSYQPARNNLKTVFEFILERDY